MKRIVFFDRARSELREVPQPVALNILKAIHRLADTGAGLIKPLSGEFEGILRLRVGNYRIFFVETSDTVTIHRVANRKDAYR